MNNPFSITFGLEPTNYIKRIKESDKIIEEFSNELVSNYVYIITGIRGSGKTVLLSNIANHFIKEDNWVVVDPASKNNILENIASEIYETAKMKKLFLKGEFSFSFHGIGFSIEGKEPVTSIITLIKKMLDYLKKKGKRILITIDEADNSPQMKEFIETYQSLLRQKYPVFLLMTGLYDNISKLQDDKSLTFMYRAPKIYLDPLNIATIANSYKNYMNISIEEATRMAKITRGYAYAYQVLGYLVYNKKERIIDESVLMEFDQYLAEYVYDKLYSELSDNEQKVLLGIKSNDPIKISSLCENINMDIKTLSVYRDRLIKKGLITAPKYGYIEFSLPRFSEYLEYK